MSGYDKWDGLNWSRLLNKISKYNLAICSIPRIHLKYYDTKRWGLVTVAVTLTPFIPRLGRPWKTQSTLTICWVCIQMVIHVYWPCYLKRFVLQSSNFNTFILNRSIINSPVFEDMTMDKGCLLGFHMPIWKWCQSLLTTCTLLQSNSKCASSF